MAIPVGEKAPDFEVKDTHGNVVHLSDFLGKKHVVLSFHPLAWTPICAMQMLQLDFHIQEFRRREAEVWGFSVDSVPSKKAWAAALGLKELPILADFHPQGAVAERFGILRKEGFSERAVIVIDKAGIVRWVKVYPIKQVPDPADALAALDTLG